MKTLNINYCNAISDRHNVDFNALSVNFSTKLGMAIISQPEWTGTL